MLAKPKHTSVHEARVAAMVQGAAWTLKLWID